MLLVQAKDYSVYEGLSMDDDNVCLCGMPAAVLLE
jgi:hypothetical protein